MPVTLRSEGEEGEHAHAGQEAAIARHGVEVAEALDALVGAGGRRDVAQRDPRALRRHLGEGGGGLALDALARRQGHLDQEVDALDQPGDGRRALDDGPSDHRPPFLLRRGGEGADLRFRRRQSGLIGI